MNWYKKSNIIFFLFLSVCGEFDSKRYDIIIEENPCDKVNILDGKIDDLEEFQTFFSCLNKKGDFDLLKPIFTELETAYNPETNVLYVESLIDVINSLLTPQNRIIFLSLGKEFSEVDINFIAPFAKKIINSTIIEDNLPKILRFIESEAINDNISNISKFLRSSFLPRLLTSLQEITKQGVEEGFLSDILENIALLLTSQDENGDYTLKPLIKNLGVVFNSDATPKMLKAIDKILRDDTLKKLALTIKRLYHEDILQTLHINLRNMFVQDENQFSDMQSLLRILSATNGPITCEIEILGFPLPVEIPFVDNLAVTILSTIADSTEENIQFLLSNLIGFLEFEIPIPGLDINQIGEQCPSLKVALDNLDALDILAQSGALNGLLPMLKVLKEEKRIQEGLNVALVLEENNLMRDLEPVVLLMIDLGVFENIYDILDVIVVSNTISIDYPENIDTIGNIIAPSQGSDYSQAPLAQGLRVIGSLMISYSDQIARIAYKGGNFLQRNADTDRFVQVFLQDLSLDLLPAIADFIDTGVIEKLLPIGSHFIRTSHVESILLPWMRQITNDGTLTFLVNLIQDTFKLVRLIE